MDAPEFWIVAGPNGAGKTTCVQKEPIASLLPCVVFLNPDDRTLQKLRQLGFQGFADSPFEAQSRAFRESADDVFADLKAAIGRNEAVGVETVLSTNKYCPLVDSVAERQGFVGLIYVALSSPGIAKERVAARVRRGGHGVPDEKIVERWNRSLANLIWFVRRATAFWIVDNSDSNPEKPPLLVANGTAAAGVQFQAEEMFPELKAALSDILQQFQHTAMPRACPRIE